ncbi:hypothetical protein [Planococcus lenghuensis]|uniref:Uncharacterized protein n=1 Tax=Planococcus lenghuensis TaxID=2213202 RepID=A0A1Q2KUN7_9BACL|nr:hypothetical protein [Planococcus lenghuensis]AQQ51836.1 hypothetical protein B0X71_01010 [Planococcus lenghuensis]
MDPVFIFFWGNMALIIALMYLALKSREYLLVKRVVIGEADAALYLSKKRGRNQASVHETEPAAGLQVK